jgi:hypothetical protein
MNTMPLYSYWKLWKDTQDRTYAEPFYTREPSGARRAHAEAKTFRWAASGQFQRSVTELHAHDGARSLSVAEGADERDVNRNEQYYQR